MSTEYKTYSSSAHVPKRAYASSAGFDFWAGETKVLKPWSRELTNLNLFMAIPDRCYGRVLYWFSGLANMHGITVHNGRIDSDYRRNVCVVLFNLSNKEYVVETGSRIAQLIIE